MEAFRDRLGHRSPIAIFEAHGNEKKIGNVWGLLGEFLQGLEGHLYGSRTKGHHRIILIGTPAFGKDDEFGGILAQELESIGNTGAIAHASLDGITAHAL